MLHCSDRTFYVGHTDDLERRVGQHEQGAIPGYSAARLPVKLVWSEAFDSRDAAREAERRLKGWGRPKKLALLRGDWGLIQILAKGKKDRASTSSAKSHLGQQHSETTSLLYPHPDHLPSQDFSLEVRHWRSADRLRIGYRLTGDIDAIVIAPMASPGRRDGLWRRTCFEAFVQSDGDASYLEYNFSPSGEWAAYRFVSYRQGIENLHEIDPQIRALRQSYEFMLEASLSLRQSVATTRLALSAVIEETDGTKSYWALRHPPGPPDFHHPDCFALTLPAPSDT